MTLDHDAATFLVRFLVAICKHQATPVSHPCISHTSFLPWLGHLMTEIAHLVPPNTATYLGNEVNFANTLQPTLKHDVNIIITVY